VSATARPEGRSRRAAGQSLVEFTLIIPVFLMILFGMIEFGFVFTHDLTVEYATREGARVGAALANGADPSGCSGTAWQKVDPLVIAAVERVLQSPGSQIVISNVSQIVIFKADPTTGANAGTYQDVWTKSAGGGPIPQGSTDALNFDDAKWHNGSDVWKSCSRTNALPTPDSIGVSLTYTYTFQTPLAAILRFFGGAGSTTLTITDQTVMQLNPAAT
jgi:hypothetical protein